MSFNKQNNNVTEYSNRWYLLEDFTKKYLHLNDRLSYIKMILLRDGYNSISLLREMINLFSVIYSLYYYLRMFIKEEQVKRSKNKEELVNLEKELSELLKKLEMLLIMTEKYYKENQKKKYILYLKDTIENIDKFIEKIEETNSKIGLFNEKVSISGLNKTDKITDFINLY